MAGCERRNKMGFPPATFKQYWKGRAGIPIDLFGLDSLLILNIVFREKMGNSYLIGRHGQSNSGQVLICKGVFTETK